MMGCIKVIALNTKKTVSFYQNKSLFFLFVMENTKTIFSLAYKRDALQLLMIQHTYSEGGLCLCC